MTAAPTRSTDAATQRPTTLPLVVLAATLAVCWPALLGNYVYDDVTLVLRNPALLAGDIGDLLTSPLYGESEGLWRPLTLLTLAIGHHLGGAAGVHAIALLLHAGNAVLVLRLAQRWLPGPRAAWVALVFALHPVQAEAVGWCAAINDPLWATATLLAIHATVRWRDRRAWDGNVGWPWLAGLAFFGGLVAKETAVAIAPLALLAFVLVPASPGAGTPRRPRLGRAVIVLGITLIAWLGLRILVLSSLTATAADDATEGSLLQPATLLLRHLGLLAWPLPATPLRPAPDWPAWLTLPLLAMTVAITVVLWRRDRQDGGALRFGVALVLLPLLPPLVNWRAIGAHPLNDRYLYLAAFGLALALGTRAWLWRLGSVAPWLLPIAFAGITFLQFDHWRDDESLGQHTVQHFPEQPSALVMVADAALQRAQAGDASQWAIANEHYRRAVEHTPSNADGPVRVTLSAGRLGLAWCLLLGPNQRRPDRQQVIDAFEAAVRAGPDNPAAWVGLGVAHGMLGNPQQSGQALDRAIELDPNHSEAWFNRAFLHQQLGQLDDARRCVREALRSNPSNARAMQMAGQLGVEIGG